MPSDLARITREVRAEWPDEIEDDYAFWLEVRRRWVGSMAEAGWKEWLHPRNRVGRFIDAPDRAVRMDPGAARVAERMTRTEGWVERSVEYEGGLSVEARAGVDHAIRVLDETLALPKGPKIPVTPLIWAPRSEGYIARDHDPNTGTRLQAIGVGGTTPAHNFAHEFGHYIDAFLVDDGALYGSAHTAAELEGGDFAEAYTDEVERVYGYREAQELVGVEGDYAAWWEAVSASPTYQHLLDGDTPFEEYLLRPHELFARSFGQWLAARSGDELLRSQVERWSGADYWVEQHPGPPPVGAHHMYWPDDEFEPIAKALDEFFGRRGWLREQSAGERADPGYDTGVFYHVTTNPEAVRKLGYVLPRGEGARPTVGFPADPDAVYMWPSRKAAEDHIKYMRMRGYEGDTGIVLVHADTAELEPDPEPFYNLWRNAVADEQRGERQANELGYRALDDAKHYPDPVNQPEGQTLRQYLATVPGPWTARTPADDYPEHIAKDPWIEAKDVLRDMPVELRRDVARVFAEEGQGLLARRARPLAKSAVR